MKKITLLLSVVIFAFAITSCNKKKIKDLEDEAAANKAAIEALQASSANSNTVTLSGNPINVSVMGNRGFDSTAFSYTTKFDWGYQEGQYSNYVYDYNDGSGMMEFYVEKYDNIYEDNYAEIDIYDFDPSVGINSAKIYAYFDQRFAQSDTMANLYVYQNGYLNGAYGYTGADNITINSFSYNETTRLLNINLTINSTETEPNNGQNNPAKVTMSYSGVLTPYQYASGSTVYRKAHK
jgi:hypothetical protein